MEKITKEQLQKLHVMLNKSGMIAEKANMVYSISEGRTTSSRELTKNEARLLIQFIEDNDPCNRMRKKVFALAYDAGIIWGDTPEDKKMNAIKINSFLLRTGAVKKDLNSMNKAELIKTVNQFEQIIRHNGETSANKATKSLLAELNIPVEPASHKSV